ncbi:amidohydrolase family protein [Brachybacterium sp. FME24]|uniref:amidohydrolase family protein n=1 Tax=Brachybacterium sp. FME24 TaxID=2742605 RepID=UPI00186763F7|nr:amidohydrolase family protein [Brachybacterium sp. FME24]
MTTRIIDVHAHLGPWFFGPDRGSTADNLRSMDAHDIDIQLVSGVEAVTYDAVSGNPALAAAITGQDRLRGMFVVDPRFLGEGETQLDELLPSGLFLGAKIHTDYAATPAGSPQMADALRLCAERKLPVLVHSWGTQLLDLAETVAQVDDVQVIAGHMGGPAWRLAPEAIRRTDRLWLEPGYSQPEADRIRWVLDRAGPERILFGTDSTLIDPALAVGAFRAAGLDEHEEHLIMHRNAERLFGL